MRVTLLLNRVKEVADAGGLDHYTHLLEQVLRQDYTTLDIAAALLKMRLEEEGAEPGTKGSPLAAAQGMARLRIEGGRNHDLRAKDILGAITGETSVPGSAIGTIDIRDTETLIEVRAEYADAILGMHAKMAIRRHPFRVTRVP
jgi:ATP-dependent RNA helicase DeaD